MKRLLFLLALAFTGLDSTAQIAPPTNREVYNFSVGDTFVYSFYAICAPQNFCTRYYLIHVTGKSFSTDSNTVYYTFNGGAPFIPSSFSDLDSVSIRPLAHGSNGILDTVYVDSTSYCLPVITADSATAPGGLSDYFGVKCAVGLGKVEDYYVPLNGTDQTQGYRLELVYYHHQNTICGSFDPARIVNSLSNIQLDELVRIYPDPVKDVLRIDGLDRSQWLSIYDATGRLCQTDVTGNAIQVQGLTPGLYFIKIASGNSAEFKKFIKQ